MKAPTIKTHYRTPVQQLKKRQSPWKEKQYSCRAKEWLGDDYGITIRIEIGNERLPKRIEEEYSFIEWASGPEWENRIRVPLRFFATDTRNGRSFSTFEGFVPYVLFEKLDTAVPFKAIGFAVLSSRQEGIRFRLKTGRSGTTWLQKGTIGVNEKGWLFRPVVNKFNNLELRVTRPSGKKVKLFPAYLMDVEKVSIGWKLLGTAPRHLLEANGWPSKLQLILKKRGESQKYYYPVEWESDKWWSAVVELDPSSHFTGVWDFYITDGGDKPLWRHRLHMPAKDIAKASKWYAPHYEKGAVSFRLYRTQNYSASIMIQTENVKLYTVRASYEQGSIHFRGTLYWNRYTPDAWQLVWKNRDTNEEAVVPVHMYKLHSKRAQYVFHGEVTDLFKNEAGTGGAPYRLGRSDLYLRVRSDEEDIDYRLRSNNRKLVKNTKHEWYHQNKIYRHQFYRTTSKRVAFSIDEIDIAKDITSMKVKNGKFIIEGQARFTTLTRNLRPRQQASVVVKNRETKEEHHFSIKSQHLKDNWIQFEAEAAFEDFRWLHSDKAVLDLHIRLHAGEFMHERKLGKKDFVYYKDEILHSYVLEEGEQAISWYVTYTPRGNVKIETITYPRRQFLKLQEENEKMKKAGAQSRVWVVGERPDTAQDTGYHFFKYCRTAHPEIEVYYAIESDSMDREVVEELGNVLIIGSDEHVEVCLRATAFFGSHDIEYFLPFKGTLMESYRHGLRVFLQHGVLGRKRVEYNQEYYKYPFHLFCVSSKSEKRMVMKKMHYDEETVQVTGLSRFDNLLEGPPAERKIVFIPTWREWLHSREAFLESEYYRRYKSFLENPKLHRFLEKNDVVLQFYPHYRMQQYTDAFDKIKSEKIEIVKLGKKTVQQLLKESMLMITDYSSVSFDFTYMQKPVIYYHFDTKRFFQGGSLRPLEETFLGDVVHSEEELLKSLRRHLKRGWAEKKAVSENRRMIFSYSDKQNAARIFQAAKELEKENR
ncbi:CDP-glycerol glycerophosphotransferase family protein [Marinococcus halophilus]|uniref:Uncharacterized protein n=1 Tax=Marinococcus halophilus TaxID=1371 RepID=A0A510Y5J6_MARHA|nr:CDP-glycerol glycerophosphotransferase family protein [Marinococcus halophilus]GEK58630.1 hypothetical protein MHA01_15350 [Marinococcus halophilus]